MDRYVTGSISCWRGMFRSSYKPQKQSIQQDVTNCLSQSAVFSCWISLRSLGNLNILNTVDPVSSPSDEWSVNSGSNSTGNERINFNSPTSSKPLAICSSAHFPRSRASWSVKSWAIASLFAKHGNRRQPLNSNKELKSGVSRTTLNSSSDDASSS
jgi:hypothetical protein